MLQESISLIDIPEILNQISKTNSKNEKRDILRQYKDDWCLPEVLKFALHKHIMFGTTKIDMSDLTFKEDNLPDQFWFTRARDLFTNMANRNLTGNRARDGIRAFMSDYPERWAILVQNILKKDLRCGAGAKIVNKVFDDLVPEEFCMLAQPYKEKKLTYPIYTDCKLDGVRAIIIVENGETKKVFSRNGKEFKNYSVIEEQMSHFPDGLYDGEITSKEGFQKLMRTVSRKVDGISMGAGAVFNIFDMKDINGLPLKERLDTLAQFQTLIDEKNLSNIEIVRGKILNNREELDTYYKELLHLGFEGIMIKPLDGIYELKRSYAWMKMKPTESDDLEIVDMEGGTGKYEGILGAFVCRLPNGNTVNVGSGFKEHERTEFWNRKDEIIGTIAEIKYQEKTDDGSLRFPVFLRFRPDKRQ